MIGCIRRFEESKNKGIKSLISIYNSRNSQTKEIHQRIDPAKCPVKSLKDKVFLFHTKKLKPERLEKVDFPGNMSNSSIIRSRPQRNKFNHRS